jgi:HSP20 family protein
MTAIMKKPVNRNIVWDEFDRFFDTFMDTVPGARGVAAPAVDIHETKDAYVLEADLPGIVDKDLDVKIDDNLLTITAERKEEQNEDNRAWLIRERRCFSYKRSFVLPKDADVKNVKAAFKNGQLRLELGKKEDAKPVSVKINVE